MDRFLYLRLTSFAIAVSLAGCANIHTIDRVTRLSSVAGSGKAIHLDAQQRLVIVRANSYCAEPSPDAMSAYASALGLGISDPTKRAASLSNALGSSAASIGLRTQSITLMRDALYRMCEANANQAISGVSVEMILRRSQDLTAVIMAIEQLTGAVTANQAILSGSSGSSASASLMANQQLLDAAMKDKEAKAQSLADAKEQNTEKLTAIANKKTDVTSAETAYQKASSATPQAQNTDELKTARDERRAELNTLITQQKELEQQVQFKQTLLTESQKVLDAIRDSRDAALTNTISSTTSSGQFSSAIQVKELSKEATESIAKATKEMVIHVLDKDYTKDSCMALMITTQPLDKTKLSAAQITGYDNVIALCTAVIQKSLVQYLQEATYTNDSSSKLISTAIKKDSQIKTALNKWITTNADSAELDQFINDDKYSTLRSQAIKELSIK